MTSERRSGKGCPGSYAVYKKNVPCDVNMLGYPSGKRALCNLSTGSMFRSTDSLNVCTRIPVNIQVSTLNDC